MATRKELATKYNQLYIEMHEEFFETINEGTPQQERIRKSDKTAAELKIRDAEITENYEDELVANGLPPLNPVIEPPRDLEAEIDELKAEIELLRAR